MSIIWGDDANVELAIFRNKIGTNSQGVSNSKKQYDDGLEFEIVISLWKSLAGTIRDTRKLNSMDIYSWKSFVRTRKAIIRKSLNISKESPFKSKKNLKTYFKYCKENPPKVTEIPPEISENSQWSFFLKMHCQRNMIFDKTDKTHLRSILDQVQVVYP